MTSFETGAAVLGGLLMIGSLLSGLARRSMLSLTAVFVLAGFVLGNGATGCSTSGRARGWCATLRPSR